MRRTQIQLDDSAYEMLRRRAFERGISMSALVREMVEDKLGAHKSPRRLEDFRFVGSGRSDQGQLSPVSERHDDALADDFTN